MTRLITDGFELGDSLVFNSVNGTVTIQGTTVRSGSYAMQTATGGANYGVFNITAVSEFYWRMGFRIAANVAVRIFTWFKGATEMGSLRWNTSGLLEFYRGTTLVGTAASSLLVNTWYLMEVRVNVHDTTGVFEIKVDGLVHLTFSGDTKPGADTTVDTLRVGHSAAGGSTNAFYDDLALNDTAGGVDNGYPGDGKVVLLTVNAAGDVTQLTPSAGSNYQNVDEVPPDGDTTYNSESTATKYDLYNLTTFTISGNTIKRVWAEARAREETAAGDSVKIGIKTNSTEYAGSSQAVTTTYLRYVGTAYATNPQTAAAWTQGEFDALQARCEVV